MAYRPGSPAVRTSRRPSDRRASTDSGARIDRALPGLLVAMPLGTLDQPSMAPTTK